MEEDMVKQARTPNQLQQLGWQYRNSGELDKAADIFAKVVRMEPNQSHYRAQLAEVLEEAGKAEEALAVYSEWFDSPVMRAQGYIDHTILSKMVGQYRALGRLEELKAKNAQILADKPEDPTAKSVVAHIAMAEHRFDEARESLIAALKTRPDPNAVNTLLEIGEIQGKTIEMVEQLEADGMFQNFWDHQQLAQVYLAAGNREKALEYWKQFAEQQGNWGLRQAMQGLYDFGLYKEAEEFYLKNRKKTRDMDDIAMDMYMRGFGLEGLVEEMLQGEVKGLVADLVSTLVEDDRTSYARGVEILTPLLEREPENKPLLELMADLHERYDRMADALPYRERILKLAEHDNDARRKLAESLTASNREAEAYQLFDALLAEKVNSENVIAALSFYHQQSNPARANALRSQVAESLDAQDLEALDERIARYEAKRGAARGYADLLKTRFEAEPDEEHFNAYMDYLLEAGFDEEAYRLCMGQAESGLLSDRNLQNRSLVSAAVRYGNVEDVVNLLWPYIRHSERWQRDNQLRRAVQGFGNLGYGRQILDAFRTKALSEQPLFMGILEPLADLYTEIGDSPAALALIEVQLGENPFQRSVLERKVALLEKAKRFAEAIEVRKNMGTAPSLGQESQDALSLATLCYDAGRTDEGDAIIDSLSAWNRSSAVAGQIGKLLQRRAYYAEALPYLERGMADANQRRSICDDVMRCYLEAGDVENARRVWKENQTQRGMQRLANYAHEDVYEPLAREIYEEFLSREPLALDVWEKLGDLHFTLDDEVAAGEAFRRALSVVPEARAGEVINGFGALLAKHGKLIALLEAPPLDDPVLLRAVVAGYMSLREEDQTDALRAQVLALPMDDVDTVLRLASYIAGSEDKETAANQYQRALGMPGITEEQKLNALEEMVEHNLADDAADQILALVRKDLSLVDTNLPLVAVIARHGDAPLLEQALARVRERQTEGDTIAFFGKLAAYYAGGEEPAVLQEFIGTAVLEEWQWRHFAKVFQDKGDKAAEVAVLARIAGGGFGTSDQDRALAQLCVIDAERGNVQEAFAHYLAISPDYGDLDGLMATLADHVRTDDLGAMESRVLALSSERPGNVIIPDYIGRLSELAERVGVDADLETRLAAAPLTDAQRRDALQWTELLEGWQVSPRVNLEREDDDFMKEEGMAGQLNEAGAPNTTEGWITLEPAATLGVINLGIALFDEEERLRMAGAYAYTTLQRDTDGPIDLTFAANQQAQVWVNGVLAHSSEGQGRVRPGQSRFRVELKAGDNHIVVKSQHNNKRWLFCLGPVIPEPEMELPAAPEQESPVETSATVAAVE